MLFNYILNYANFVENIIKKHNINQNFKNHITKIDICL